MKRFIFGFVVLALTLTLFSSASAQSSYPVNGNFDIDASAWTFSSSNGLDCGWSSTTGSPHPGSVWITNACTLTSQAILFPQPSRFTFSFNYGDYDGVHSAGLLVRVLVNGSVLDSTSMPVRFDWETYISPEFVAQAGDQVQLRFEVADFVGHIDTVAIYPQVPLSTPTSTPPAGATVVSGTGAIARLTLTAPTPYFSSSASIGGGIPLAGPTVDPASLANINVQTKNVGFCMPSEVTRFFTDIDLCATLPLISLTTFKWMGVDMLPYFALITTTLIVVFIIRQLQEK